MPDDSGKFRGAYHGDIIDSMIGKDIRRTSGSPPEPGRQGEDERHGTPGSNPYI